MRTIVYLFATALLVFSTSTSCKNSNKAEDNQLKIISFNVRVGVADRETPHDWDLRKDACCAIIVEENPVVFGVQEALTYQMDYFEEQTGYKSIGVGRDDGVQKGEIMGIFYKEEYVTLEDWGTFWLSETPDQPSKGWDAYCNRTATWAVFTHNPTGKKFFFMNTHFDLTDASRENEAIVIAAKIPELNPNGLPMILTGDFNTTNTDPILDPIKEFLLEARSTAPVTDSLDTYNGWGNDEPDMIDHIFYSGMTALEFRSIRDVYFDVQYASDHFPVFGLFEF